MAMREIQKNVFQWLCLHDRRMYYNIEKNIQKRHSLPPLVFFAAAEEWGCVSRLLSESFSMIQYNKEKFSMKHPLQLKITLTSNATKLNDTHKEKLFDSIH